MCDSCNKVCSMFKRYNSKKTQSSYFLHSARILSWCITSIKSFIAIFQTDLVTSWPGDHSIYLQFFGGGGLGDMVVSIHIMHT